MIIKDLKVKWIFQKNLRDGETQKKIMLKKSKLG
jgi:hypothetical protein